MEITRRTDYAIRMLIALARESEGGSLSAADLARMQDVPYALARGILSQLARAGFVVTRRGAGGGVCLACPAEQIDILSIVECIEGPLCMGLCTDDPQYCEQTGSCVMHQVWKEAEAQVRALLASRSLAYLADQQNLQTGGAGGAVVYLRGGEAVK